MFLCFIIFRTYLHPNAPNAQKLSDSEYSETKPCLVSETLVAPYHQSMQFKHFGFLTRTLKLRFADFVFPEVVSDVNNAFDSAQATGESKAAAGKGFMDYVEEIKQNITVTVVDMMNTLSDTFQSFFGGSQKDGVTMNPDGTAGISMEQNIVGATLMGLAIMVISVVLSAHNLSITLIMLFRYKCIYPACLNLVMTLEQSCFMFE
ncbi:hypothetical protein Hdeb2414_s0019g00542921 [Helianthus debilis subsp. tardiflorus]